MCGKRKPRSAFPSAQSDWRLHFLLPELLDTIKCINGDETLGMHRMVLISTFCAFSKTLFRLIQPVLYSKCPKNSNTKVSDKMTYANSADPDQTAPEGAV